VPRTEHQALTLFHTNQPEIDMAWLLALYFLFVFAMYAVFVITAQEDPYDL
jgi:hypothetical protein